MSDNLRIISDDYSDVLPTRDLRGGHLPRDWSAAPLGHCAKIFDLPAIPKNEWRDRIEERKKAGVTARQVKAVFGIKSLHQGQTNYCWVNAAVHCLHYLQARTGRGYQPLSPASVGARVKSFQNVGGWSTQAVAFMRTHGVNYQSDWPANAIDRRYATPANIAAARANIVTEWLDFPVQGVDREQRAGYLATAVLNGLTVACGYNWWSHAVTVCDLDWINGQFVWLCDNSGAGRDANGETILSYAKGIYDDAVAPSVVLPTQRKK